MKVGLVVDVLRERHLSLHLYQARRAVRNFIWKPFTAGIRRLNGALVDAEDGYLASR
jgi:hypothetical protein